MPEFYRDIKYSVRNLSRDPGFAVVVVLTLALGIGGNSAILAAAHTILFAPLPFPHSRELVRLRATTTGPTGNQNAFNLRGGEIQLLEEQGDSSPFLSLVAMGAENRTLTGSENAERVSVSGFHGNWNSVLGIAPIQGRWFSAEEEQRGDQSGVVVIAASLWNRRFAGNPGVLGKSISLDNRIHTVVGVMPAGFRFPYDAEVWTPTNISIGGADDYAVFGRLKSGVTLPVAMQALAGISQKLVQMFPRIYNPGTAIKLWDIRDSFVEREDRAAAILAAVGGFFLLLATLNVASLVLSRSVMRRHEQQIRAALGAGRWHLARRSLAETLVLSMAGGALGVLLAAEAGPFLNALLPAVLTHQLNMSAAGGGLFLIGVALGLSLLTGVIAGVLPAVTNASVNAVGVTRGSARIGRSRGERVWMDVFVSLEFTLAVALTTGAGLMLRDFSLLTHRDLGIDTSHLLALHVSATDPRYATAEAKRSLVEQVVRAAESAPGVSMAGVSTVNPLGGTTWTAPIAVEGQETKDAATSFSANHRLVTPRAIEAMGIRLLQGRWFTEQDNTVAPNVAIVSRRMSQKYWQGRDVLGKRVRANRPGSQWLEIVGVVSDVNDFTDPAGPRETWYLPYAQHAATPAASDVVLMVRSVNDPRGVQHSVEQSIHAVNRDLALYDVSSLDSFYMESLAHQRLMSVLISLLAGFGLLLGSLGIYGTLSFAIRERVREIGIRMALGATAAGIVSMIMKQGLRLALIAAALGLGFGWGLGRLLSSQLSEVAPGDPTITFAATALLLVIASAATYLSARQASRLDPLTALKRY